MHNFEVTYEINSSNEKEIIEAIIIFKGLRHRMQFLGNVDGVNFN